jgi:hypothetical protein
MLGANATKEAAAASAEAMLTANRENIEFSKWLYGDQKEQAKPWYDAGSDAIAQLAANIKSGAYSMDTSLIDQKQFTPERFTGEVDLQSDPSYQFRLSEGLKAVNNNASATGSVQSGAQAKALNNYAQDSASKEYQAAFERAYNTNATNNTNALNATNVNNAANLNTWNALSSNNAQNYNYLKGVSDSGLSANGAISNAANTMASSVGNSITNTGNALADMYNRQGQATADMYSGIATSVNSAAENAMLARYLKY